MPKVIELTVELDVQRVSCPGVWLCQDGRVSLTVYALGTSYQTCLMHPIFPLMFKDVFYFRKRFQETCSLNNICCLLKDETIYCELVQWCEDCHSGGATVLAQYLGTLNDVLFPPNMCSNEGVDLLMRRSKDFPGILSPKIEITTKVRIDEVWNTGSSQTTKPLKVKSCNCTRDPEGLRQKQVCHTPMYHRVRCTKRTRSRSRSCSSRSLCSLNKEPESQCEYRSPVTKSRVSICPSPRHRGRDFHVYNVQTPAVDTAWRHITDNVGNCDYDDDRDTDCDSRENYTADFQSEDGPREKLVLESKYINQEHSIDDKCIIEKKKYTKLKISPCVCEICKRYHQLFHGNVHNS